jgi:hypothetical protein
MKKIGCVIHLVQQQPSFTNKPYMYYQVTSQTPRTIDILSYMQAIYQHMLKTNQQMILFQNIRSNTLLSFTSISFEIDSNLQ